jgi:hypothetical protein
LLPYSALEVVFRDKPVNGATNLDGSDAVEIDGLKKSVEPSIRTAISKQLEQLTRVARHGHAKALHPPDEISLRFTLRVNAIR